MAAPAFAAAPVTDGTLSVKDARGVVQLSSRGSLIGRFERGKVTITSAATPSSAATISETRMR